LLLERIENFARSDNVEAILNVFYDASTVRNKMSGNFINS